MLAYAVTALLQVIAYLVHYDYLITTVIKSTVNAVAECDPTDKQRS